MTGSTDDCRGRHHVLVHRARGRSDRGRFRGGSHVTAAIGLLGFAVGYGLRHNGRPYWLTIRVYRTQYALFDAERAYVNRAKSQPLAGREEVTHV